MRVIRRVGEDLPDDPFGEPAGALILLQHDPYTGSGFDVRSSRSVHVSYGGLLGKHFLQQPAGIPHIDNAFRFSELLLLELRLALRRVQVTA
jgi:hypothetical protein